MDAGVAQTAAVGRPQPGAQHRAGWAVARDEEVADAGQVRRLGRAGPRAVTADRVEQQVPVWAPWERWAELEFAAQRVRGLQAWRQPAAQPELAQAMLVVSRREPVWAALREPRKPEQRELALPALAAVEPVLAPRRPEPLVLLQQELVE